MPLAIFDITNSTLNLAVSLAIFALVVVWLAMVAYTFLDARRRVSDPFLVGCATVASLFPFIGTAVYAILRPPELIEDAREREIEMQAAELRVRQLIEQSCPGCGFPVDKNYLRCPQCERHLKDPCDSCSRPVDPRWAICPYCEAALPGRRSTSRRRDGEKGRGKSSPVKGAGKKPPARASGDSNSKPREQEAGRPRESRAARESGGKAPAGSRRTGRSSDR